MLMISCTKDSCTENLLVWLFSLTEEPPPTTGVHWQITKRFLVQQLQSLEASLANLPPNIMNAIKVLPYSSKVITCHREKKPAEKLNTPNKYLHLHLLQTEANNLPHNSQDFCSLHFLGKQNQKEYAINMKLLQRKVHTQSCIS